MSAPTPRTDEAYAKWQEGWDRTPFGPDFARTLERELATERARLDWLESKKPILWALEDYASGPYWLLTDFPGYTEETTSQHKTARAAIDAAMKEDKA